MALLEKAAWMAALWQSLRDSVLPSEGSPKAPKKSVTLATFQLRLWSKELAP